MSSNPELGWLLDEFVRSVPQVEQAVILSRDGLATASSATLSQEDADRLAAIAAGFHSLARGAVRHLGGSEVRQTIVEMDSSFMFVTAAGAGSCLAVVSSATGDVGLIAYEMALLIKKVGSHVSVRARAIPKAM